MKTEIKFPYYGWFTSKKGGYLWHYKVNADGWVDCMWRRDTKRVTGGWREIEIRCRETKECLKNIEEVTGRKTDGFRWED